MSTDTNGEIEDLGGAGEGKMLLHFIPPVSGHSCAVPPAPSIF